LKFSNRAGSGILVIDMGAFKTKATMVGPDWIQNVAEVPTEGFRGYISDLDAAVGTLRKVVSEVFKTVPLENVEEIGTILTIHISGEATFRTATHEISIPPASDEGKVNEEQIRKLHDELRDKLTAGKRVPLFFSISRYSVIQGGSERDVENPRGLRVERLKGMAVAITVPSDMYDNLYDMFHEYNATADVPLLPLGIYSSPIYAALGVEGVDVDTHIHLDLGYTSFRIIRLENGRVHDFYEFPEGGKSLIQKISSTLSITFKEGRRVLETYLETGDRTVQASGKLIETAIIEEIMRASFRKFLNHTQVKRVVNGGSDRPFTLSVSGGFALFKRIHNYISDAGFPEPLDIEGTAPNFLVFNGIRREVAKLLRKGTPSRRRNGWAKGGILSKLKDKVVSFVKKEIAGLEEKEE